MSEALARNLDLLVLEAAFLLVVVSYLFERTQRDRRWFDAAFVLLGILAAASFVNFGDSWGRGGLVHGKEQFHFFLGSKYLTELRYDAIYDASILAVEEVGQLRGPVPPRRDPLSFRWQEGPVPEERAAEIRSRFTPERWSEFRRDASRFWSDTYLNDHGNTGSPAWALGASAFTRTIPYDGRGRKIFGALDLTLLGALFAAAAWALGPRAAGLAMITGLTLPLVPGYLLGSILRMDWIFALGLSVCLFQRRFLRSAGLILGYAVASKLLAGVFVLPLGLRFLILGLRHRALDRDLKRYVSFAILGLLGLVALSGLAFGFRIWAEYAWRMLATFHERYYMINHSLRDVFLQFRHDSGSLWVPLPRQVFAALGAASIDDARTAFLIVQLAILAVLAFLASRHRPEFAFALGPLAVFTLLVSNRYYWQMWLVAALALAVSYRSEALEAALLAGILLWIGALRVVDTTPQAMSHGGYLGSYLLLWMILLLLAGEALRLLRARGQPTAPNPGIGPRTPVGNPP